MNLNHNHRSNPVGNNRTMMTTVTTTTAAARQMPRVSTMATAESSQRSYSTSNNSSSNTSHAGTNNKEALVEKLQGALNGLRRDRDQLHRSKELALERCRLAKEEEKVLSNAVAELKDKHQLQLIRSLTEAQAAIAPLEAEVKAKTGQMRFQHAELLRVREKIQKMTEEMALAAKDREASLARARKCLNERRKKQNVMERRSQEEEEKKDILNLQVRTMPLQAQANALAKELEGSGFLEWEDLPKIMEHCTTLWTLRSQKLQAQRERMEREIGLYGEIVEDSNPTDPMDGNEYSEGYGTTM